MRRLPGPATEYALFVPVTVQFDTATWNSLRTKKPACRSAAYVQRILRTRLVGTAESAPDKSGVTVPWSELKSSVTLHCVGDVPFANVLAGASHVSAPVA